MQRWMTKVIKALARVQDEAREIKLYILSILLSRQTRLGPRCTLLILLAPTVGVNDVGKGVACRAAMPTREVADDNGPCG